MTGASITGIKRYAFGKLKLQAYFEKPGDGRLSPDIPASNILWSNISALLLRIGSALGIERLLKNASLDALGTSRRFSDDTVHDCMEHLDPDVLRAAFYDVLRRVKKGKSFAHAPKIGLVLDGTGIGNRSAQRCPYCRPKRNKAGEILYYQHCACALTVVAEDLHLPLDIEPYGAGDSEYAAGKRLLERAIAALGRRFADYLVADGKFATAPFLNCATALGIRVIARLKNNLPTLKAAVDARFANAPPKITFTYKGDRFEVWEADDFEPWENLQWTTVRVVRYRQSKPDGTVIEADWLTNIPRNQADARRIVLMAKSRWSIENQGFNDAKNRYHLEHISHHEASSITMRCLLIFLTLTIERLYRLRHIHRGAHAVLQSIDLWQALIFSVARPPCHDSS